MNFDDLVFFQATILPEKAAIILSDRGVTYAQPAGQAAPKAVH